ncbi:hypothetical protein TWF106_007744 [Orbilia oligospora]|uniref:F-box domain-containing protein n=1 Tax=Orbilia oligospora TaxID=2813651 RepID=A0A7C8UIP1_ORBOL|nr:hypothetical protein TWF106_007744 [Orbilia oligospora]
MAEFQADDHQPGGSSTVVNAPPPPPPASSSSSSTFSTSKLPTPTQTQTQTQTQAHTSQPATNGTPGESSSTTTGGTTNTTTTTTTTTTHRDDVTSPTLPNTLLNGLPKTVPNGTLNGLPNGSSNSPPNAISNDHSPKTTVESDKATSTDPPKEAERPKTTTTATSINGIDGPSGEATSISPEEQLKLAEEDGEEEGEEASVAGEAKELETKPTRKKPGPSSDITAAEWDGGMAKEDVQDNLDDLENADSESEATDEKVSERSKLEKGKAPIIHLIARNNPKSTNSEKKRPKHKPLKLIDLPLDVLKEIVREVTNTTDLCSLCLAHSSLHALAIPLIYSRFDIVWPDQNVTSDRTGVDALTYGLATLVSNENEYAQYVRKFSLGNGPKEWVGEYATNKEGGKMLGTLVGLAVWKMGMLETFSWDMPTGILRDVWRALHRLNSLQNIHVRWHDNSLIDPAGSPDSSRKIERPTFSGLKGLKSLSVLDVDELVYLREMALAVEKSYTTLRELRLGIAIHAGTKRWAHDDMETITPDTNDGFGEGGAIGIIVGKICDFNKRAPTTALSTSQAVTADNALTQEQLAQILQGQQQAQQTAQGDADNAASTSGASTINTAMATVATSVPPAAKTSSKSKKEGSGPSKQLKLQTLELERVPISTRVLTKAIDFSYLVNLTLLNCSNQSKLYKTLRRKFSPYPPSVLVKLNKLAVNPGSTNKPPLHIPPPSYRLRLKKIHTDMVSVSLIEFLHSTLAPNSLETLFLQEIAGDSYVSTVELVQILHEVLRRHRLSLQRLLIDSYVQHPDVPGDNPINVQSILAHKSKWCFNQETISFMTEMPRLRELAFGVEYSDWHYMITRLPEMKSLKSLYIPHVIGGEFHKLEKQSEEFAKTIVDVVTLRPECGLCYVGIVNKCFELLEGEEGNEDGSGHDNTVMTDEDEDDASDDDDGTDDGNDDDGSDDGDETEDADETSDTEGSPLATSGMYPSASFDSFDEYDDDVLPKRKRVSIREREILFYDDKVAVFKARFGKL